MREIRPWFDVAVALLCPDDRSRAVRMLEAHLRAVRLAAERLQAAAKLTQFMAALAALVPGLMIARHLIQTSPTAGAALVIAAFLVGLWLYAQWPRLYRLWSSGDLERIWRGRFAPPTIAVLSEFRRRVSSDKEGIYNSDGTSADRVPIKSAYGDLLFSRSATDRVLVADVECDPRMAELFSDALPVKRTDTPVALKATEQSRAPLRPAAMVDPLLESVVYRTNAQETRLIWTPADLRAIKSPSSTKSRWAPEGWLKLPTALSLIGKIVELADGNLSSKLRENLMAMHARANSNGAHSSRAGCARGTSKAIIGKHHYSQSALLQIYDGVYEPIGKLLRGEDDISR